LSALNLLASNEFSAVRVIGVMPGDRSFQGRGENQTPGITLKTDAITVPVFSKPLNTE
jgi:hypothetical protein